MPHLTIVTGASRGLGLAIAEQLCDGGHTLVCIARRANDALAARAAAAGATLEQWTLDLADPLPAAARLERWLAARDAAAFASATLINNAALVAQPGPLQDVDPMELQAVLRVGLEAPLQLTAAFLRATAGWPGARRILDISSGLGRRAMAGQAPYCAVKAGLDHHARCVALDEARRPNGAKIVSLAPGVIATDMQVALRSSDEKRFPDVAAFRQMHASGALASPHDAALRVLGYLARADYGQNPVADVRDA
jgi:NAD(P)-dependent dehydrogenase (short-subunit alcohol dehydrogenase family)